jgi:hypothetical protein
MLEYSRQLYVALSNLTPSLADVEQQFAGDIENGLGAFSQLWQTAFFSAFAASALLGTRLQQIKSLCNLMQTATGSTLDLARNALKQTLGDKGSNLFDAAQALQTFGEQPWDKPEIQSGLLTTSPGAKKSFSATETSSSTVESSSSSTSSKKSSTSSTTSSTTITSSGTLTSLSMTPTPTPS